MPKESFEQVMEKIRAERRYQDNVISPVFARFKKTDCEGPSRPIAAEILMMQSYLHEAAFQWMRQNDDDVALDAIRKVAAMAIRCLENHGCPERP